MTRTALAPLLPLLAAACLLAGCGASDASTASPTAPAASASSATTTAAPTTTSASSDAGPPPNGPTPAPEDVPTGGIQPSLDPPTTTVAPATSGRHRFGTTVRYPDGLTLRIGPPALFHPGPNDRVPGVAAHLIFDVTIGNGAKKPYDAPYFSAIATAGGEPCTSVMNTKQGIIQPNRSVPAGATARWRLAFGVRRTSDLVVEVTPDLGHRPVTFAS